jgi:hypothetical protein
MNQLIPFTWKWRTMKKGLLTIIAVILMGPRPTHAEDDPIKYAWTCASSTLYGVTVQPGGQSIPFAGDPGDCANKSPVYVELKDNRLEYEYSKPCDQKINTILRPHSEGLVYGFNTRPDEFSAEIGASAPMSLIIERDDVEWRFIISMTELLTSKGARELRYGHNDQSIQWKSEAKVSFITGECILKK